jgi:malto-oligosyltrehalose trehalohydrolase
VLEELAERVAATADRPVHLILENEENEARRLERDRNLRPRFYTAQWNDDVHHVLHTATTGERNGYYADYLGDTNKLGRSLAEGFAFQGETMAYRGSARGESCRHLPPTAFIGFLQNHDQIGNRAFGDRLTASVEANALRAAAATCLLLPQIPLLFMGEEWAAEQPFPFFCHFGPELAKAVSKGRREEFSKFPEFRNPEQRERIPDPQSHETFASGKLRWEDLSDPEHGEWFTWYKQILTTRRNRIVPLLCRIERSGRFHVLGPGSVRVWWDVGDSEELILTANLSNEPVRDFSETVFDLIWQEGAIDTNSMLGPWTVLWQLKRKQ